MANTYFQLLYHVVWSTKNRLPLIQPAFKERLYEYIGGTLRQKNCCLVEIGGMPDHIHLLVAIPPKQSISEITRNVKSSTAYWLNHKVLKNSKFGWQDGYGVFTVSSSNQNTVKRYIQNQEEHHRKRTFKEEFLALLNAHHISFDERYLWK